jgi:hypothetical protein
MERTYWAHFKSGRSKRKLGPFTSHKEAVAAVRRAPHKAGSVMVGYGSDGAWFDIQWPDTRPEPSMARTNDFMM